MKNKAINSVYGDYLQTHQLFVYPYWVLMRSSYSPQMLKDTTNAGKKDWSTVQPEAKRWTSFFLTRTRREKT